MPRVVEIVTRAVYWLAATFSVGMLFGWAARHYEQTARFHWAVTSYWAFDAWGHWFNAYGEFEHEPRALYNAIPFALFLILGLLRTRVRGQTRTPVAST